MLARHSHAKFGPATLTEHGSFSRAFDYSAHRAQFHTFGFDFTAS